MIEVKISTWAVGPAHRVNFAIMPRDEKIIDGQWIGINRGLSAPGPDNMDFAFDKLVMTLIFGRPGESVPPKLNFYLYVKITVFSSCTLCCLEALSFFAVLHTTRG